MSNTTTIPCKVRCSINYRDVLIGIAIISPKTGRELFFDHTQVDAVPKGLADRIRAVPLPSLRASLRVDSCVPTAPSRGRRTVLPAQRIAPVENRKESRHFPRFLNRGNPSRRPFRTPLRDAVKSRSARPRSRNAS